MEYIVLAIAGLSMLALLALATRGRRRPGRHSSGAEVWPAGTYVGAYEPGNANNDGGGSGDNGGRSGGDSGGWGGWGGGDSGGWSGGGDSGGSSGS